MAIRFNNLASQIPKQIYYDTSNNAYNNYFYHKKMAIDTSTGNIYISYRTYVAPSANMFKIKKSTNDGASWTDINLPPPANQNGTSSNNYKSPAITINNGYLYVAFWEREVGETDVDASLYYNRYNLTNGTWLYSTNSNKIWNGSNMASGDLDCDIVVCDNEDVHIYYIYNSNYPRDRWYDNSTATWNVVNLQTSFWYCDNFGSAVLDSNGSDIHVAMYSSNNTMKYNKWDGSTETYGGTATSIESVGVEQSACQIYCLSNGNLYLGYESTTRNSYIIKKSTNNGVSWTDIATMSLNPNNDCGFIIDPIEETIYLIDKNANWITVYAYNGSSWESGQQLPNYDNGTSTWAALGIIIQYKFYIYYKVQDSVNSDYSLVLLIEDITPTINYYNKLLKHKIGSGETTGTENWIIRDTNNQTKLPINCGGTIYAPNDNNVSQLLYWNDSSKVWGVHTDFGGNYRCTAVAYNGSNLFITRYLSGAFGDKHHLYEYTGGSWVKRADDLPTGSSDNDNVFCFYYNGINKICAMQNGYLWYWNEVVAWVQRLSPYYSTQTHYAEYNNILYSIQGGQVIVYDNTTSWNLSYNAYSISSTRFLEYLCVYNNNLYCSFYDNTNSLYGLLKFNGSSWSEVISENDSNKRILNMVVFNNGLYGINNNRDLYKFNDTDDWEYIADGTSLSSGGGFLFVDNNVLYIVSSSNNNMTAEWDKQFPLFTEAWSKKTNKIIKIKTDTGWKPQKSKKVKYNGNWY